MHTQLLLSLAGLRMITIFGHTRCARHGGVPHDARQDDLAPDHLLLSHEARDQLVARSPPAPLAAPEPGGGHRGGHRSR